MNSQSTTPLLTSRSVNGPLLNGTRNLRNHNSRISQRVHAVPPSGIRRYFDIAATMDDVISLGIGEPDFVTPAPVLQAGINSLQRGHTAYTSNAGMLELRGAVAQKLSDLYGGPAYDPEQEVLITVGVSEAMYLIMQAILDPGDEVIVPQPCFVSYTASVILAGGKVIDIPTYAKDDFRVEPQAMRAALTPRTKALLIGFPSNPTGAVMDRAGMLEIARIAEQHDLIVISDEIYDRLVYGDHQHVMFASLPGMAERTVHLGGMSNFAQVDVIACPVAPTTAFRIGEKTDNPIEMYLSDIFTISLNLSGMCGISVPCGFDRQGLPIGLQLIGPHLGEATILRAAHAYEQSTTWRERQPELGGVGG